MCPNFYGNGVCTNLSCIFGTKKTPNLPRDATSKQKKPLEELQEKNKFEGNEHLELKALEITGLGCYSQKRLNWPIDPIGGFGIRIRALLLIRTPYIYMCEIRQWIFGGIGSFASPGPGLLLRPVDSWTKKKTGSLCQEIFLQMGHPMRRSWSIQRLKANQGMIHQNDCWTQWHSQSANLKPIEHLWIELKRAVVVWLKYLKRISKVWKNGQLHSQKNPIEEHPIDVILGKGGCKKVLNTGDRILFFGENKCTIW